MIDKNIKKILDDSDKAELLEFVNENLPKCKKAVVMFEVEKHEVPITPAFIYHQYGFEKYYELYGFLRCMAEYIEEYEGWELT